MIRSRKGMFAAAFVVGLAAGWILTQRQLVNSRRELFSRNPLRRLAALGFLAGQDGIDTIRLLRDYLGWERRPMLRGRADAIVRRMQATLG